MNYCQKEEFLFKKVQKDLGDCYQYFFGVQENTSFNKVRGTVKKIVRS